jgi:hypothetical protein
MSARDRLRIPDRGITRFHPGPFRSLPFRQKLNLDRRGGDSPPAKLRCVRRRTLSWCRSCFTLKWGPPISCYSNLNQIFVNITSNYRPKFVLHSDLCGLVQYKRRLILCESLQDRQELILPDQSPLRRRLPKGWRVPCVELGTTIQFTI